MTTLFEKDFPEKALLQILTLRFYCMKAVASAKWPSEKPVFDATREQIILGNIAEKAAEKGIDIDTTQSLFQSIIEISKAIQTPWCNRVWPTSERNANSLLEEQYLKITTLADEENIELTPCDSEEQDTHILFAARDIINVANERIMDILGQADFIIDVDFSIQLETVLRPLVKIDGEIEKHIFAIESLLHELGEHSSEQHGVDL